MIEQKLSRYDGNDGVRISKNVEFGRIDLVETLLNGS
jgi:hypothetical protein